MSDSLERYIDPGINQTIPPFSSTSGSVLDRRPLVAPPDTPITEALTLMSQGSSSCSLSPPSVASPASTRGKRASYVLVMVREQLVGIFTERDVVKLTAQGTNLATVTLADVMTQRLITLQESALSNPFVALDVFRRHRIRHLPILNETGRVIGVVTPDGLRLILQSSDLLRLRRVGEAMSANVIQAPPTATVLDLAQLMATHQVSCVVIVEASFSNSQLSIPIGIITERDVVQFQALDLTLATLQAREVMSAPLVCLRPENTLWEAHQTMQQLRVRRLVVAYGQGELAGILTQTSVLSALDPVEMHNTIEILQQQVKQLRDEKVELLQTLSASLETQVRAIENRFQVMFEQAAMGIALVGLDGRVLQINQRFCDMVGYSRAEFLSKRLVDIIHLDDQQAAWRLVGQLIRGEISPMLLRAALLPSRWLNCVGKCHAVSSDSALGRP